MTTTVAMEELAILGGPRAVEREDASLFHWPIVTGEDEQAVLEVLRSGRMSQTDITVQFEAEWARYMGTEYALGHCNGTTALLAAMWAIGLRRGDEMIVPSVTYWASALGAMNLGAVPVFADIHPRSLCIDPADIEHRITPRTRAIMVVHYCGHPCDMDPIMAIAKKHGLYVIEDVSHAHGALYKGRMTGSIGHVSAMSMMAGKSFPVGEGGMLCTSDRGIWERAIAYCHYERIAANVTDPAVRVMVVLEGTPFALPAGGLKGRMNQTCSAMGRVQLRHYPQRIKVIQDAMNRFWDELEGVPGLRAHRPEALSGSTMGGWYNPVGHYVPEELGGLSVDRFMEAVSAEGGRTGRSTNAPLHLHPLFHTADIYGDGRPTILANATRDTRMQRGALPVSEALPGRAYGIPYFKHDRKQEIQRYAAAYRKVALQADKLLKRQDRA